MSAKQPPELTVEASPSASVGVTPSPWSALRRYTDARVALGRVGHSLPTSAHLAFQLDHAQARDAVHLPLDTLGVLTSLHAQGLETLLLHSAAPDRASYLQRPDWGRRLDKRSHQTLADWRVQQALHEHGTSGDSDKRDANASTYDLAFVIADGLSARAVHSSAVAVLAATLKLLNNDSAQTWSVAPVAVVEQGRVAVGDEVGQALRARAVVVVIGERPGLSSPDSLGVYLSWAPKVGLTDASRNCISNVRPAGLSVDAAAAKLHQLLSASRLRQRSGIALKDEGDELTPKLSFVPPQTGDKT